MPASPAHHCPPCPTSTLELHLAVCRSLRSLAGVSAVQVLCTLCVVHTSSRVCMLGSRVRPFLSLSLDLSAPFMLVPLTLSEARAAVSWTVSSGHAATTTSVALCLSLPASLCTLISIQPFTSDPRSTRGTECLYTSPILSFFFTCQAVFVICLCLLPKYWPPKINCWPSNATFLNDPGPGQESTLPEKASS